VSDRVTYFTPFMVDHNIMRLHISVHDTLRMTEIERLETTRHQSRPTIDQTKMGHLKQLKYIEPCIEIRELGVENLEVHIVHVFGDQAWNLRTRVPHDVEERQDIGPARQVLEYFNFTLDLLLFYRFKDFDDTWLLGDNVYTFKYLKGIGTLAKRLTTLRGL
jgi:hypothetical protein